MQVAVTGLVVGATKARCSSERVKRAASLRGGSAAISIAREPCARPLCASRFAEYSFFVVVVVVATLRHQKNGTPPRKRGLFLFSRLAR